PSRRTSASRPRHATARREQPVLPVQRRWQELFRPYGGRGPTHPAWRARSARPVAVDVGDHNHAEREPRSEERPKRGDAVTESWRGLIDDARVLPTRPEPSEPPGCVDVVRHHRRSTVALTCVIGLQLAEEDSAL